MLVPGCGVARLPLEVAGRGYRCQANEFSVFMLMAAHFMLNGTKNEETKNLKETGYLYFTICNYLIQVYISLMSSRFTHG